MLKSMSKEEFEALVRSATILEAVGKRKNRIKVARLQDGRILKMFRRRGLKLTSKIRKPYCVSFKDNADKLISMGIPSIHVEDTFYVEHMQQHAVVYPLLSGIDFRTKLTDTKAKERKQLIERFAEFVAELHLKGVHFRALHLGNIIITEEQEFGLIDVADMTFRSRSLKISERCRNFEHITRYKKDIRLLTEEDPDIFIEGYITAAKAEPKDASLLRAAFQHGCENPKLS